MLLQFSLPTQFPRYGAALFHTGRVNFELIFPDYTENRFLWEELELLL